MSGASAACTASAVQAGTHSESSDETADVFVPSAGLRLGIFLAEGLDRDGLHLLLVGGLVVEHAARGARDGIDDVHAFGHLAERSVLLVEVRSVHVHDEKLAAGGVRIHGAGHGQHAAGVLEVVFEAVARELTLDAVARAAHAGAGRVAALDHEAGDDAVEDHAVIKALFDQTDKVTHGVRRDLRVELGADDAAVFHFNGDNRIAHQ